MRITFVHMLNNFSGSPNVLSILIRGFVDRGHDVRIITNYSQGFLSDIPQVKYQYVNYKWNKDNKFSSLFSYLLCQFRLFFVLLFDKKKNEIYYINTIIPFAAILACKLTNKHFYIHVHENMSQSKPFYCLYRIIYRICNRYSIFVSEYVKSQALNVQNSIVAYNGLDESFLQIALSHMTPLSRRSTILMLCSLRVHKGIYEFIRLARNMPQYPFELVVSDNQEDVNLFIIKNEVPNNMKIFALQTDVHPFYQRAKLVLNLSLPDLWVETFGLTLLEGMTYGIPVIGPDIGGPCEIIDDNLNGYLINPSEISLLQEKIYLLMSDNNLYSRMSNAAQARALTFSSIKMVDKIENYLQVE